MRISDWSSDVCSSDLLMITIGRRFWRTLRDQHAGRAVGVPVSAVSTLAADAALGWAAHRDSHAVLAADIGSGHSAVFLAVTLLAALAAHILQWDPLRASDRRRQASAILAVLALTSALSEVFLCMVSGSSLDAEIGRAHV